jgi:hypothetical protein
MKIGLSLVTGIAIGVLVLYVLFSVGPQKVSAQGQAAGGDEPIVMAGGSLHFLSGYQQFLDAADHSYVYLQDDKGKPSTRYIGKADLLYISGGSANYATQTINSAPNIAVTYCKDGPCSAQETLNIGPYSGNTGFKVTVTNPIDPATLLYKQFGDLPNVIRHSAAGHVQSVNINGSSYATDGKCTLIIHFCTKAACAP